jgi:hypothetical protein
MSYPIETRSRSGRQQKNKINLPPDQCPSTLRSPPTKPLALFSLVQCALSHGIIGSLKILLTVIHVQCYLDTLTCSNLLSHFRTMCHHIFKTF